MKTSKIIYLLIVFSTMLFFSCSETGTDTKNEECSAQNINGICKDTEKTCNNGICVKKVKECNPECDENHICDNGECKERPKECNEGDFKCVNNHIAYQTCNENGKWSEVTACSSDKICNDNTKKCEKQNNDECIPDRKKCSLDKAKILTCSSNAVTWDELLCDSGKHCTDNNGDVSCTAEEVTCTPNESICFGASKYKTCSADGNVLSEPIDCPISEETGELTKCYNGKCEDECQLAAERRSYMGCEYYAVDLDNTKGIFRNSEEQTPRYFSIIVSNPSSHTSTVTITDNNGFSTTRDVLANAIEIFEMDTLEYIGTNADNFHQWQDDHQIIGTSKGSNYSYKITSTMPIIAYQFSPLGGSTNYSNDASMLIPITAYDKTYRMMSWEHFKTSPQTMTIVAKEDNTELTVTLKAPTEAGDSIPEQSVGGSYSVTLSKGETIQFASKSGDLSGSYISANKGIGVFGGHRCTNIPNDKQACDHIEEQLFPINTWGAHYVVIKTKPRGAETEYYKLITDQADTIINFNPAITAKIANGSTITLSRTTIREAGSVTTFSTKDNFELTSSKAISLGQFITSQNDVSMNPLDSPTGDPAFIIQVPVEQYRSSYLFLVPNTYAKNFVTIVATSTTVTLDNNPIPVGEFISIGAYYYTIKTLSSGSHSISSSTPIGISVYGYDRYVSYGYPGGLDLRNIKGF